MKKKPKTRITTANYRIKPATFAPMRRVKPLTPRPYGWVVEWHHRPYDRCRRFDPSYRIHFSKDEAIEQAKELRRSAILCRVRMFPVYREVPR
ncbi:MAG: hypothetical protein ACK4WH_13115 [Phycisphaerales bacterium]